MLGIKSSIVARLRELPIRTLSDEARFGERSRSNSEKPMLLASLLFKFSWSLTDSLIQLLRFCPFDSLRSLRASLAEKQKQEDTLPGFACVF
jgi:hypothetical protein